MSYSDHEGVTAIINVENSQKGQGDSLIFQQKKKVVNSTEAQEAVSAAVVLIDKALLVTKTDQKIYTVLAFVSLLLFMATFSQFLLTERYFYIIVIINNQSSILSVSCWTA